MAWTSRPQNVCRSTICEPPCVEQYSEPLILEINVSCLCESGPLIQSVDVCVKAQSRRSCCAFLCTCAYVFVSLCCSQFPLALVTCTDDPHRLKRAIKTQVRSQLISLSIHAVASLNKIVGVPVPRNSETHGHWITTQRTLRMVAEP